MSEHKYKLLYEIEEVDMTGAEARATGKGATDALLIGSCLYPEDGSFSFHWLTVDGRNERAELSHVEVFKIWALLGSSLAEKADLDPLRRGIAKGAWEAVSELFLGVPDE